jgi:Cu(I)/Ag(I) efflux system membrane fusion protein
MKTKQIIILVVVLVLGVFIGKVMFNTSSDLDDKHENETVEEHWTCSMHPEIDLPEFGACPKCGMDLIPKGNDDEGLSQNAFKMSKNAMALANIETMTIGNDNGVVSKNTLNLSGKIAANDKASAVQTAHFGGRLERLMYKSMGEYVKKGSLIASVYSPELVTAQNEFIEALNIKNAQPELYNAVRNKLKNWKISENQIQQIERTKTVITNFKMYANVSGYIDEVLVQEGHHVKEGTPLFKVSNLGTVWAVFDVYEQDIKHLKIGQHISIKPNAYPNKILKAKINFINPNLNSSTRTIAVRATLSNVKNQLKPGMLLTSEVAITSSVKSNTKRMLIPKTAVLWTGKRSVVYLKTDKNEPIFELRNVEIGDANGDNYNIISGLEHGDEVVVQGAFTVDAAAQLKGKNSMMNASLKKEKLKTENPIAEIEQIKDVNPKFIKQLNVVFKGYLNIKDAFVLTDSKKVSEQAKQTLLNLKKVKMTLLKKKEAHNVWMSELPKVKNALTQIQQETDVEKQRETFINLSNAMIVLANSFGVENTIYVQHCPMANGNKGADWLSTEKVIKNPYFGDKMLSCGSVEKTIK